MNIDDFERLLRDGTPREEFPPEEHKWQALERDLGRTARRKGAVAFRKWLPGAVAASLLLLLSAGTYFRYSGRNADGGRSLSGKAVPRPVPPAEAPAGRPPSAVGPETKAVAPEGKAAERSSQAYGQVVRPTAVQREALQPADTAALAGRISESPKPAPPAAGPQRKPPGFQEWQREPDKAAQKVAAAHKTNLGVSALYGLSGVGKRQYRLSVDARRSLSGRLFANVQLIASAAAIETKASYEYQVISVGPPGIGPSPTVTQQAEAVYSGNIYTLGLSPSLGFRLTKSIAVSAGPDLQKSVGGAISLRNRELFLNQFNNESLIDEQQSVAALDIGLQSAAQVSVNRQLSVTLLYRYGLTDYLKRAGNATRNSFLSVGLSYQFIH